VRAGIAARIGLPFRCRRNPPFLKDPADRGCAGPVSEPEDLAPDPLVPQPWFSVASRSMSAVITA
jgi:hypothetical protein